MLGTGHLRPFLEEIKAKRVKKRDTDREDAWLLRRLMRENGFLQIWVLSLKNRDLRQLVFCPVNNLCMSAARTNSFSAAPSHVTYNELKSRILEGLVRGARRAHDLFVQERYRLNRAIFSRITFQSKLVYSAQYRPEIVGLRALAVLPVFFSTQKSRVRFAGLLFNFLASDPPCAFVNRLVACAR